MFQESSLKVLSPSSANAARKILSQKAKTKINRTATSRKGCTKDWSRSREGITPPPPPDVQVYKEIHPCWVAVFSECSTPRGATETLK